MAISSPGITLAVPAMFANIKPVLDGIVKLGVTDFSADAPQYDVKPGATIKVPVSSIAAAEIYNASTNNYLSGGATSWATLTATHYLQGFDVSGADIDSGVDAAKIKQLFAVRAGSGIAAAIQTKVKDAIDGATTSTEVTLPNTLAGFLGLGSQVSVINGATSVLAVNGSTLGTLKGLFAAESIGFGSLQELAAMCGFKDIVLVPGMTASAAIVPAGSMGFLGRVPTVVANYVESGAQTDEDTGLSIGIVVADDQATNRQIVDADFWFGVTVQSANAAATTAGVVKIA